MIYHDGAISRLSETLAELTDGRRVVLLADRRTWTAAGQRAHDALRRGPWRVETLIVPDGPTGSPVCDDVTRDRLNDQLPPADLLLAVGAGVVNDLAKWIGFER
ncbi:MAG: sn-glycerol-1-phosphate dehydrogenase, partial [Planctomycetes bacterium]|nr:sn-glycerol-1-phosphate dehydrogenase [Planctomycetota bacterium]